MKKVDHRQPTLSKNMANKVTKFFGKTVEVDVITFAVWVALMLIFPLIVLL
jgi:hypothetical protein